MREAIGNTFLYYIVIFLVTVILLLLVASIAASKAYRVKNRIVDTIEKYECYEDCEENDENHDSIVVSKINSSLASIGYQIKKNNDTCPNVESVVGVNDTAKMIDTEQFGNLYAYCIYKIDGARGPYYKVISYMYFEIPLINQNIKMPIYGTTKSIYTRHGEVGGGGNS